MAALRQHIRSIAPLDSDAEVMIKGTTNRQQFVAYFNLHQRVPHATFPPDLGTNEAKYPGGRYLKWFLVNNPNVVYKFALDVPTSTWAAIDLAEQLFPDEDPIDEASSFSDSATSHTASRLLSGLQRPYPNNPPMVIDEVMAEVVDVLKEVSPWFAELVTESDLAAAKKRVAAVVGVQRQHASHWPQPSGFGHSKRVILRYLCGGVSMSEMTRQIREGRGDHDDRAAQYSEKERELKPAARVFCLEVLRQLAVAKLGKRKFKDYFLKYWPHLKMIDSDLDLLKFRIKTIASVRPGEYYTIEQLDMSKWGPTFDRLIRLSASQGTSRRCIAN